jgi:murein DD-endopeptidase MepM/ murein hydrolase activator NlpD
LEALDAQLAVLDKTDGMLTAKYATRSEQMRQRVRAAYKLLRAGWVPLWVDKESRAQRTQRRVAARRVLSRDQAELAMLREEMESVANARQRILRDRRAVAALHPPEPGSLHLPVAFSRVVEPVGHYRHDSSRARLTRRGLILSSRPGRNVRAVASGEVRYTGHVRGLGDAVIVDHGDFLSIVGELAKVRPARGDRVERGEIIGEAALDRVYFEVRLEAGAAGFPVDPAPLIEWRQ